MSALLPPATDLLDELRQLFPFELDDFQIRAIQVLAAGESVVVCAPTGSGKTLIGEYAIYRALSQGKRVFYTTPLKALSNQKFRDFGQQFGPERVGLLTGDISINRDAPVLVMTTEIFRNMLYGTPISLAVQRYAYGERDDGTEFSEGEVDPLRDVQAVILDECHYMNDQQRGTVWEEAIIYCPPHDPAHCPFCHLGQQRPAHRLDEPGAWPHPSDRLQPPPGAAAISLCQSQRAVPPAGANRVGAVGSQPPLEKQTAQLPRALLGRSAGHSAGVGKLAPAGHAAGHLFHLQSQRL
jgi:hypothetical protein